MSKPAFWFKLSNRSAKCIFVIQSFQKKSSLLLRRKFLEGGGLGFRNEHLPLFGPKRTVVEISTANKSCAFGNFNLSSKFCTISNLISSQTQIPRAFWPKKAISAKTLGYPVKLLIFCQNVSFSVTLVSPQTLQKGP